MARGDMTEARDCMAVTRQMPEVTEVDNFVIECWSDVTSPRMGGGFEVIAAKCRAVGIAEDGAAEVWHRARLIERTIANYRAAIAAAQQNAQT